jgi:dynactin complex subunit
MPNFLIMKKLSLLTFLGVIVFIGGQWLGISMSMKKTQAPPNDTSVNGASVFNPWIDFYVLRLSYSGNSVQSGPQEP